MSFQTIILMFTLGTTFFMQTSQTPIGTTETQENIITTLFKNAQGWLLDQEENFIETDDLHAQTETINVATIKINCFTIFSKSTNLPLVQLRMYPYCYFSFTEHASPNNLSNTPLAPFLTLLQNEFALRPGSITVSLNKGIHFTCELSNENIHCVGRGFNNAPIPLELQNKQAIAK